MTSQQDAIRAMVDGAEAEEIADPSGMAVIRPDNMGLDAALISYMKSHWYRNGRSNPRAALLRLSSGDIVRPSSSRGIHYRHRRAVETALDVRYATGDDGDEEWIISRAPMIDTRGEYVEHPAQHDNLLRDEMRGGEPFNFEARLEQEREDDDDDDDASLEWTVTES